MGRLHFLSVILGILFTSCVPFKNYYYDDNGITKPKKPKFDLAKRPLPYQLKKTDLIDTNSVYINSFVLKYKDGSQKLNEKYLRFFNNGRSFFGINHTEITNYKNFDTGWIGYYKIDNNNGIVIEEFRVYEVGKYVKMYGYIKNDSIFLFDRAYKDNNYPLPNENNCTIYIRKKIINLTGAADW